ncbi:YciI family protein [Actinokineospora sp. PR83]|uniref:YciI family protein n=1 Tax=Actinokineospora sp. PR83 TaxID=2884908 RepID=UPI001F438537|nr:YciI family protein [Actinokineospora sp. PR83]MCG8916003.1 YciI family protein [Actinokineospora sp. PR83]
MRQYLLSIFQPPGEMPDRETLAAIMAEVGALNDEMRAAGAWVFGNGLEAPDTATVLRADGDDVLVTDGPFVELKEHLGGFTVINAEDLDDALAWGRKLARVLGLPVEVRPFVSQG